MRAVIQRVSEASVKVEGEIIGQIKQGFVVLLGFESEDTSEDVEWITNKIVQMRIFGDEEGKMNRSLLDIQGELLLISQFTLHASTKKGNRPSFIKAARPDTAIPFYERIIELAKKLIGEQRVQTGSFGADMKVSLVNDGPVTITMDSKNKE